MEVVRPLLSSLVVLVSVAATSGHAENPSPAVNPPARSGRTSMMLNAADTAAILKALSEVGKQQNDAASEADTAQAASANPNIYVSAVAQFGPGQWTVWANGYRIVPGRQPAEFQVLAVRENDQVDISVPGDKPIRFILRPHQTWLAESETVIEGIVP